MVIKTSVFERIEPPWFGLDEVRGHIMTEDVWFCRQAWRRGIEVWCDPTIPVKHIGEYAYY
jgi:GT2 family glycosyltransferase